MSNQATIILGHGSRSAEAVKTFEGIVALVSQKSGLDVHGAHMEHATPTLVDTIEKLYSRGVLHFKIIPYFLYNGNHIKIDIPGILETEKARHEGMTYSIGSPIGFDPLMADILIKKIAETR